MARGEGAVVSATTNAPSTRRVEAAQVDPPIRRPGTGDGDQGG
jgi:hypothetical protein